MRDDIPPPPLAWPVALAGTTLAGTLATACMMPFVGLAVVAAATMNPRRAALTLSTAWVVNQLLGFGLLGYPLDGYALRWGAALGIASIAALAIAQLIVRGLALGQLAAAFAAAFVVYEVVLLAYAGFAGGLETFVPGVVARIALNDAAWLVALAAFRLALGRTAPRWFGTAPTVRFA
jgi:hypothetical protein